ncbi:MAG: DUF4421 domain-containing protein [Bacteroidaceae bacterium]|nr:DUF4421 domain-containing protein [Bacteroidaceae bacterium]
MVANRAEDSQKRYCGILKTILLILIFIGWPLCIHSQAESYSDAEGERRSLFVKSRDLLIRYLDSFGYDSIYIRPQQFYYTLMIQQSANFENYTIRSIDKAQRIRLAPDNSYKLGAYFGWHGLFLGASVNTSELFSDRNGANKKAEYFFNLYGRRLGADLFFRRTGNDFKIRRADGFSQGDEIYNFNGASFSGMKVRSVGANVYYVFNNKQFSYPAAYSQTTVQKVSRGTWVGGISWSHHHLDFDHTHLPVEIQATLSDDLKFKQVKYMNFNFNFGYAYNWVFAENWLLAVSLTPAIAYKASRISIEESVYNKRYNNVTPDLITRAGVVYNNNRFFAGASTVAHVYQYYQKNFALTDNFGVLNVYAGFNFGRRN